MEFLKRLGDLIAWALVLGMCLVGAGLIVYAFGRIFFGANFG